MHPEYLLDGVGYQPLVALQKLPLSGVLVEEDDSTSDQLGHGLAPCTGDEHGEGRNVIVAQSLHPPLVVEQDGLGELVDQETIGFATLGAGQIQEVPRHVQRGLHPRLVVLGLPSSRCKNMSTQRRTC